ncbi:hypothetical protein EVAR_68642_1 [Eumeta japonica]|uniref:Uncharacterized protein n=1 Tax=Eumeta variegata TaxID=151549 RepID=A0A4C2A2I9_EUMVA|nr:hypothetical protein EVAR_68642_1 [Eumeta japonica]
MLYKPPWHGSGLPLRPGDCRQGRWRGVQEKDFEGLYTGLYSRSNLLEPDSGLLSPRTRRNQCIRAGVRGRCDPHVLRIVGFVDRRASQSCFSSRALLGIQK